MMTTTKKTTEAAVRASYGLAPIKETFGGRGARARRLVGRSLGSALAMSVACGATMMVASRLRSGSPWAGLNAMATAVGLGPKKAKKRFDMTATIAGAGVLAVGLLVYEGLTRARSRPAASVVRSAPESSRPSAASPSISSS